MQKLPRSAVVAAKESMLRSGRKSRDEDPPPVVADVDDAGTVEVAVTLLLVVVPVLMVLFEEIISGLIANPMLLQSSTYLSNSACPVAISPADADALSALTMQSAQVRISDPIALLQTHFSAAQDLMAVKTIQSCWQLAGTVILAQGFKMVGSALASRTVLDEAKSHSAMKGMTVESILWTMHFTFLTL